MWWKGYQTSICLVQLDYVTKDSYMVSLGVQKIGSKKRVLWCHWGCTESEDNIVPAC